MKRVVLFLAALATLGCETSDEQCIEAAIAMCGSVDNDCGVSSITFTFPSRSIDTDRANCEIDLRTACDQGLLVGSSECIDKAEQVTCDVITSGTHTTILVPGDCSSDPSS